MTADALSGLISQLEQGWGSAGYRFERIRPLGWTGGAIGYVCHADGSRFQLAAGRYGETVALESAQ